MKSLPILLTACLLLATTPLVGAAEACLSKAPREETLAHPTKPGHYLVIDTDVPEKTGEWEDTNTEAGIQTEGCLSMYRKDAHSQLLP